MKRIEFDTISNISPIDENSWRNKIFLTLDIDWASDEVLEYTIDIIEKANVSATWFVTHNTALLQRLRSNPKFELGNPDTETTCFNLSV
jgi:hypothetical protein